MLISFDSQYIANGLRSLHKLSIEMGYDSKLYFPCRIQYAKQEDIQYPILKGLEKFKPDIVGISLMTYNYNLAVITAKLIKRYSPETIIVWGGWHPSSSPSDCLPHADFICLGEGEISFLALIKELSVSKNPKIQGIYKAPPFDKFSPLLSNLDCIPPTHYNFEKEYYFSWENNHIEKLSMDKYLSYHDGIYHVFTGRGCPYACKYCCEGNIHDRVGVTKRTIIRYRSVKHIMLELEEAIKNKNLKFIEIYDSEFLSKPYEYIKQFSGEYKKRIGLPFYATFNTLSFNNDKFNQLVKAGLKRVRIGIQHGSPRIRKIYNRQETDERILEVFRMISRYSSYYMYPVDYDLILDSPWENEKDIEDTVKLISKLSGFTRYHQFQFVLLPGSALYEEVVQGKHKDVLDESEYTKYIIRHGSLGIINNDIAHYKNYLKMLIKVFSVYSIPSYFSSNFIALYRNKVFRRVILYLYKSSDIFFRMRFFAMRKRNKIINIGRSMFNVSEIK